MIAVIKRVQTDPDYVEIEHGTVEELFLKTRNDSSNSGEEIESISIFQDITRLELKITDYFNRISTIAEVAAATIDHECFGDDTAYYARMLYFLIEDNMKEIDKLTYAINEDRTIRKQQKEE